MIKRNVTQGARELRRILRESGNTSIGVISRTLGVEFQTVWRWADGLTRPSYENAVLLEEFYKIPLKLWARHLHM